ncbi:kinase-like domain-containing protein [Fennellomyces sp. T-0311]|nr:kinase-like domain-containing protein [Fennellomyces sp. T-0311]
MSRSATRNQKAKLATDYNDLLKELSSHEMTSVGLYSIGETIGEGTFGKVKLGTHKLTGQKVAIKRISKQHAPMVAREIHLHRQLKHPNIVTLYEIIVTENNIHVISEYCPHGELFEALTEQGRYSEAAAARWFAQIADAIRYCHSQDIIHRDLKLENILLDRDDNAKLCDFGFARQAQARQMLETFCGSLAYSAPEVILRQKYTGPETDIWSLGVILYTLLAGELPFDDDSDIVTQRKIVKGDYAMPAYFSPEAADLITRMLKLNPSERVTIDQVAGHPWLRMTHDDDSDNEWNSTPSRNSSHSDIDSIFSAKVNTPDMEDDLTEISSYASFTEKCDRRLSPPETAKFSPQVRYSLGMMSHEELRRHARSPRFSAPTVSNRTLLSPPSYRSSLPSVLPSYNRCDEIPMTPKEQQLANALVVAGIDDVAVREMRNGTCDALNGLWNILLERPEKRVSEGFISAIQQKPAQIPIQLPAKYTKNDAATQTMNQGVDAMTQTYSASDISTEKGWFSSMKSWFGTKNEPEPRRRRPSQSYRNVDAPLRGDQPRRYWDNDEPQATPVYRTSSNQKHRRRVLQLSDPPVNELDQLHYSSTTASRRNYHPIPKSSLNNRRIDLMRPPVAATVPEVTNTLSIVTTEAIPSQAKEVDICEKRYSMMMYRPSFTAERPSASTTNGAMISIPPMAASAAPLLPLCTPPQQQCEQSSLDTPATPVFSIASPSSSDESSSDEEDDPTSPAPSLPTPQLDKRSTTSFGTQPSSSFNLPNRAEFAPRSRLSVYGMNSNPSSRFAAKAIIEEEEEEEE